jgi:hypothetical protein
MVYSRTVAFHKKTAPQLKKAEDEIHTLFKGIVGKYPVAHPVYRHINALQTSLLKLKSNLDDDFHRLVDSDEARSNIYYNQRSQEATMDEEISEEEVSEEEDDFEDEEEEADTDLEYEEEEEEDDDILKMLSA